MYHYLGLEGLVGQLDVDLEDLWTAFGFVVGAIVVVGGVGVGVDMAIAIGNGRCGDLCRTRTVSHELGWAQLALCGGPWSICSSGCGRATHQTWKRHYCC